VSHDLKRRGNPLFIEGEESNSSCSISNFSGARNLFLASSRKGRRPPEKEEVSPLVKVAPVLELLRRPGHT